VTRGYVIPLLVIDLMALGAILLSWVRSLVPIMIIIMIIMIMIIMIIIIIVVILLLLLLIVVVIITPSPPPAGVIMESASRTCCPRRNFGACLGGTACYLFLTFFYMATYAVAAVALALVRKERGVWGR
jgi:hypothetical protein